MLDTTAAATINQVLADLDRALAANDPEAAAALFEPDGYWRDLASFTWNIRTMEGRGEIAEMLRSQLPHIAPRAWTITPGEDAEDGGGFLQAWIDFETETGRGHGHIRVRDGRIWTLLTTLAELKGARGASRRRPGPGASITARFQVRKSWAETPRRRAGEPRSRDAARGGHHRRRPGRDRARRAAASARRADHHRRAQRASRRQLAQAVQVALPARPGVVRPPALHAVPRELAGLLAQGQDRRLARDVHPRDGAELLDHRPPAEQRELGRRARRNGEVRVRRDGEEIVLRPKQLVLATGMSGKPNVPKLPGQDVFEGEQHHSSQHPGPDAYEGQAGRRDRLEQLGARHRRRALGGRRRRDHGAAVVHAHRALRAADGARLGALYSEEAVASGITTDKADLIFASIPYRLLPAFQKPVYDTIRAGGRRRSIAGLEKAGFMLDWGDDDTGLFMKTCRRSRGPGARLLAAYRPPPGVADELLDPRAASARSGGSSSSHFARARARGARPPLRPRRPVPARRRRLLPPVRHRRLERARLAARARPGADRGGGVGAHRPRA